VDTFTLMSPPSNHPRNRRFEDTASARSPGCREPTPDRSNDTREFLKIPAGIWGGCVPARPVQSAVEP
jgi:hypothetical protein